MIIHHSFPRNTTEPYTCPSGIPSCPSIQSNNANPSQMSGAITRTPLLNHTNLVGVLVIVALLVFGIILWLCFGRWSKPIRHFLRGKSRCPKQDSTVRIGLGDGLTGATSAAMATPCADLEKAVLANSGSSSSSSSSSHISLDQDAIEVGKSKEQVEPAPPEKVRARLPGALPDIKTHGDFFAGGRSYMRSQSSLAVSLQASTDDSDICDTTNLHPSRHNCFFRVHSLAIYPPYHTLMSAREMMPVLMSPSTVLYCCLQVMTNNCAPSLPRLATRVFGFQSSCFAV